MIQLRKANDRGTADHGWLKTFHTFSFADYHDPEFMGFRSLRVINEDYVSAGQGFGTHPHQDMEILTYVIAGALEHKDSMGNGSVIRPGNIQLMSAGSGVTHSEFNHSKKDPVHLLQIWILPREKGLKPSYQEKSFDEKDRENKLYLLVSPSGEKGSAKIHQDAYVFSSLLKDKQKIIHTLNSNRHAWIQLVSGQLKVNGTQLQAGDGASASEEKTIELSTSLTADFLLFDII